MIKTDIDMPIHTIYDGLDVLSMLAEDARHDGDRDSEIVFQACHVQWKALEGLSVKLATKECLRFEHNCEENALSTPAQKNAWLQNKKLLRNYRKSLSKI